MNLLNQLEIQTSGKIEILGDYQTQLDEAKVYCTKIEINKIENAKEYNDGFKISKKIKEAQDKIKEIVKSLDDEKIQRLKENLLEINKILAGKNSEVKSQLEQYKNNEKDLIIETGFANINMQNIFNADFEVYKNECLLQFKGRSKFDEMQSIAIKIAEDYSNKLEMQQLKYDKNFSDLKAFCLEIGLTETDYTFDFESKKIVETGKNIEEIKAKFKEKLELQQKAIQRKIELEKQAVIQTENKLKLEPAAKPTTNAEGQEYSVLLKILGTKESLQKLKEYLVVNKIKYEILK